MSYIILSIVNFSTTFRLGWNQALHSIYPKKASFATRNMAPIYFYLLQRVLKGGGGVSDPISQCYFMKNPIPIKDFFKIPTCISNVVYNNKSIR